MRNNIPSPLDVAAHDAHQTQDIKAAFNGEGAVIHEVDEENNPEDPSDGNRHSILKLEKGANSADSHVQPTEQADATAMNFNKQEAAIE